MARQRVCKQGRDDIKVKVNVQSHIPTSFDTTDSYCCVKKMQEWGLHTFTFTFVSSLACFAYFWFLCIIYIPDIF